MSQNNENKLVDLAVKSNFYKAVIIDTFKITFNPIFREYCKENICGQYNKNLSCPPFCGTYEQMKAQVLSYKKALVFQSKFTIDNLKDDNVIKKAQKWHNTTMFKVIQSFDIKDGLLLDLACGTGSLSVEFSKISVVPRISGITSLLLLTNTLAPILTFFLSISP